MRKILHALCAVALVSLTAAAAHAAEKTRLERLDVHGNPSLKFYISVTDSDGRVVTGRNKEDLSIVVDSAEQGAAVQLQTFEETKDPVNLVVVVENGQPMLSVFEDVKRGIAALADSLPPKSKMAVIAYASDFKRVAELGAPVEAESAAKTMAIESEGTEEHMLQAVRSAIDILGPKPAWPLPGERKLIVVFSDGLNDDMELRTFSSVSKRAADAGIVIDTIGYTEFDQSKLRTLSALAKQSQGAERICKSASDISNHFNNVIDEIKKQYVATFEGALQGGDNKVHQFQIIVGGKYSNIAEEKLPKASHPIASKTQGSRWWLWTLIFLGVVGLLGLIAWLIFREKPEAMPEEEEAPAAAAPVVAAAPQGPMKTMALNVSVGGGAPAVGWIVATNGKHADQTFKLKPARTLIGTGTDCDVKVDDQFMSSHHCEVRFEGSSFKLFDLGSTNGIVVNDKKVREHELVDNDLFRLGRTEFKFKSIT